MSKKASKIKVELIIFSICLLVGLGMITWSVLKFDGGLKEFLGQLHIAVLISLGMYLLVTLYRLIFLGVLKFVEK